MAKKKTGTVEVAQPVQLDAGVLDVKINLISTRITWSDTNVIHTYFDYATGIDYATELKLLLLFIREWEKLGYKVEVLNEAHARKNPRFDAFMAKILTFPSVNGVGPETYEARCYQRHLCGELFGGVFVDHDLFPRELLRIPVTDELTLFEPGCPSMIVGSPSAFGRFVDFILALEDGHFSDQVNGANHGSDMYLSREAKLPVNQMVKQFSEDGWRDAPFWHFSHHSTRNHRPRHEWIPKLMSQI